MKFLFLITIVPFLITCKKDKGIPPCTTCVSCASSGSNPTIQYDGYQKYGADSLVLKIKFCDKEGDIGLGVADTTGIFLDGNIRMIYYSKDSVGNWSIYDLNHGIPPIDTLIFVYRVPPQPSPPVSVPLTIGGYPNPVVVFLQPSQILQGDIQFTITPLIFPHAETRFEINMYDKAMHKSNTIMTESILL